MSDFPKVSILVNNFKGTTDLKNCLNALLKTDYPNYEVLVMDCCTPNFSEWINKFPTIKSIHQENDIGTAQQKNIAFKHSDKNSKYVCFIDDDIIVSSDWLKNLVNQIENDDTIGMIQPILLGKTDHKSIDSLGHLMSHTGYIYKIPLTKENFEKLKSMKTMDIFYAETAIVVSRRELLDNLTQNGEPFDGDYFIGWDDIDLSWRVWLQGFRVIITSESICYHDRGHSSGLKNEKALLVFRISRNRLLTLLKNYELPNLLKYYPITIMMEFVKALMLLRYKPDHAYATMRGIFWPLTHLNYVLHRRSKFRNSIKVYNNKFSSVFVKTNMRYLRKEFDRHYH